MPTPRTSRWRNFVSTGEVSIATTGRTMLRTAVGGANTQDHWKHINFSVAAEVTNTFGLNATGWLGLWKVDQDLDETSTTELEIEDTAVFKIVPVAIQAGIPFRYQVKWPSVTVDEFTQWGLFIQINAITTSTTLDVIHAFHAMRLTRSA